MTTAQKTWTSGDVLSAADMNTYARGGQEMGYAAITADVTGITTVADVTGLSVTWTAISTRVYELEFHGSVLSTVAGDNVLVTITDSGGTAIAGGFVDCNAASRGEILPVKARLTGVSGSVTYKVRCQRNAGTGSLSVLAAATRPAFFLVKDIGAN